MSSKVEINTVAEVMKRHKLEPATLREILEELRGNQEAEDVKPPAVKKQFVFVLSDPTGKIRERIDVNNLVGWVVQIAEDASPHSTLDRIFASAYDYNASKKGRMLPVKSVGEALESVSARYFKENEAWVKTKHPVGVIVTDNVLPKDEFRLEKVDRRSKQPELPEIENMSVTVRTKEGGFNIDAEGIHKVAGIESDDPHASEVMQAHRSKQSFRLPLAPGEAEHDDAEEAAEDKAAEKAARALASARHD